MGLVYEALGANWYVWHHCSRNSFNYSFTFYLIRTKCCKPDQESKLFYGCNPPIQIHTHTHTHIYTLLETSKGRSKDSSLPSCHPGFDTLVPMETTWTLNSRFHTGLWLAGARTRILQCVMSPKLLLIISKYFSQKNDEIFFPMTLIHQCTCLDNEWI